MGSENAHRCTQYATNGFCFDFFRVIPNDGDEFLKHIITGDETWVSFVNVGTKEQSKQWLHTHSPNKPKNLNKPLPGS
jgi:hypothetical protein